MNIELLVVPDCPNEAPARAALARALAAVGIPVSITTVVIEDHSQAQSRGFAGSPSFFIDGHDLFTSPTAPPALACRLYSTPTGLQGLPDHDTLTTALTATNTKKGT